MKHLVDSGWGNLAPPKTSCTHSTSWQFAYPKWPVRNAKAHILIFLVKLFNLLGKTFYRPRSVSSLVRFFWPPCLDELFTSPKPLGIKFDLSIDR